MKNIRIHNTKSDFLNGLRLDSAYGRISYEKLFSAFIKLAIVFFGALALQACGSRNNSADAPPAAPAPAAVAPSCPAGQVLNPQNNTCVTPAATPTIGTTHLASALNITDPGRFQTMVKEMTGTAGQFSFCIGTGCPSYSSSSVAEIWVFNTNGTNQITLSLSPNISYGYTYWWNISVGMTQYNPIANGFVLQQASVYSYLKVQVDSGTLNGSSFPFTLFYKGNIIASGTMSQVQ